MQTKQRAGYVVVMTACIDPSNGRIKVQRNDPLIRLQDYSNSLRFWLHIPDQRLDKIVLIENTGYSLDSLQKLVRISNPMGKQVEFISLSCNEYPEGIHYGYAELNMIDKAFSVSKLINECAYLIKVTGRLTFPAITRLLDHLPKDFLFSVDCRKNSLFVPAPQIFVTTQLMIFSTSFYEQHLFNAKSELSEEVPLIENLLFRKLLVFKSENGAMLRWPVNVNPVGYAAHWHKKYTSPRNHAINLARAVCRKILPRWWV